MSNRRELVEFADQLEQGAAKKSRGQTVEQKQAELLAELTTLSPEDIARTAPDPNAVLDPDLDVLFTDVLEAGEAQARGALQDALGAVLPNAPGSSATPMAQAVPSGVPSAPVSYAGWMGNDDAVSIITQLVCVIYYRVDWPD